MRFFFALTLPAETGIVPLKTKKQLSIMETIKTNSDIMAVSYRARVTLLSNGDIVINPVKEGSRGPRVKSTLLKTPHGKLQKTAKSYYAVFRLPVADGITEARQNLTAEVCDMIKYFWDNEKRP